MRGNRGRVFGTVVAVAALVLLVPVPTGADPITGYDHPADVFVMNWNYVPSTVEIERGQSLTFGNYDLYFGVPAHSLDEEVVGCTAPPYTGNNPGRGQCTYPRFSSGLVDHGQVHRVRGVELLPPGKYTFTCQAHGFMRGTLVVK